MEHSCNIIYVVLLLLALGTGCIAKPGCQAKTDVTCPAGTFYNSGSCKCEDCPEHTFSNKNVRRPLACSRCKLCEGVFQYKVRCSRTQDAQCECKPGFRCSGMECDYCHRNCEHGEEPTENGCQKCPPESFNNETNSSCKPWTNCLSKGLEVLVNGSTSSDTVCSPPFVTVVIPVAGVSEEKKHCIQCHHCRVCLLLHVRDVPFHDHGGLGEKEGEKRLQANSCTDRQNSRSRRWLQLPLPRGGSGRPSDSGSLRPQEGNTLAEQDSSLDLQK